jgi:hypothetical protein
MSMHEKKLIASSTLKGISAMTIFANAAVRRIALSLCVVTATATAAMAYSPGHIQNITVTSRNGVSVMGQYYAPNRVSARYTRVCLVNDGPRERALTHSVTGINPLRARAFGGSSCANFPSYARVPFGLQDGTEPAQGSVPMVMSLSAFRGGIVTFVWH